ncbi:MAG: DNA recombination/repair protein RecA [Actinomycetia bacterium]|nr:DNA recombination/repair protein RecA [Actinomycetes bacterium]
MDLNDLRKSLAKQFGDGAIRPLGEIAARVPTLSTGLMSLDLALNGGLPQGRVVEMWGNKSVGKSTLAQQAIGQYLRDHQEGWALLIDAEGTYLPSWGALFGVDPERTFVARGGMMEQEMYAEKQLGIVEKVLLADHPPGIIVVDSIPALVPKAEWEDDLEDRTMGLLAELLGRFLRRIVGSGRLEKAGTTLILVNQVREKTGARSPIPGYTPETRPGGRAIGFYASLQIEVKRGEKVMGEDPVEGKVQVGHEVFVRVEKCKYNGPPFKTATLMLNYHTGFDAIDDLVSTALKLRVIERRGPFYAYGDLRWQGREALVLAVRESPELAQAIRETLRAAL